MARWLRPTDGYAPLHPAGTTRCTALASEASRSFNWSHLARCRNVPATQMVGLLAHLVNVGFFRGITIKYNLASDRAGIRPIDNGHHWVCLRMWFLLYQQNGKFN